jgi:hypothetical protein
MKKISQKEAGVFVIDKLLSKRYFGAHQLLEENISKGVPKEAKKIIGKAVKALVAKEFLLTKKKHYGVHISLNPRKVNTIRGYLAKLEDKLNYLP